MKTLLYSIVTFTIGSVLLTSCNQGASLTLTKRHYTKGYYVDYTAKHEAEKPNSLTVPDQKVSVSVPAVANEPATNYSTDASHTIVVSNNTNVKQDVASSQPTSKKSFLPNAIKQVSYKSVLPIIAAPQNVAKTKAQFENTPQGLTSTNDEGDHRVHSLFWLVITIILILWLIGILTGSFGLGVLFNLLLLVAIVLFILWLLWLI